MNSPSALSIGELARRTGLSVSTIRYYEARGLVRATRGSGNQRRFACAPDIRRLSFALIAQQLGLTLSEIEAELSTLPHGQSADARGVARHWRENTWCARSKDRDAAARTNDLLDGCIGCGCLSLDRCALYNPHDRAARAGPGPRFLLGDKSSGLRERLTSAGIWQGFRSAVGSQLSQDPAGLCGERSMHFGATMWFTEYSISPSELAVTLEERGV